MNKKVGVKAMVTHKFKLADTKKGFWFISQQAESIKVIIEPQR